MFQSIPSPRYRKDIDGLRALAVLAVIVFHFGHLPNGYLGVDIFFVISGFLITGIIHHEVREGRFSIVNFYLRRIRRILPLTSFICIAALVLGMVFMLPDDLENLAQSVIATNFFSNNILQAITTKNYWDVVNEYKPLMHTWSLGIEEQYYLFYPFLFLFLSGKRVKLAAPLLAILAVVSLALFFWQPVEFKKFYYLPYRFYELAAGGVVAIVMHQKLIRHRLEILPLLALVALMLFPIPGLPADATLLISVALTCLVLMSGNSEDKLSSFLLENRVAVFIGKISFSLYMWHQLLLAFARYFVFPELHATELTGIFVLTVLLSVATFYAVEQPFRNKKLVKTWLVLAAVFGAFVLTNAVSFYLYKNAGILRDVPELRVVKGEEIVKNMHGKYNSRVREMKVPFTDGGTKLKVLVVGDSFARDWANIMLETPHADRFELSYLQYPDTSDRRDPLASEADLIFVSTATRDEVERWGFDPGKVWSVGTKNFGTNAGIFYNYTGDNYYQQRTDMMPGFLERNDELRAEFPDRYIDLISYVIDEDDDTMPVFTPNQRFISQDCRHLTIDGGQYFGDLLTDRVGEIIDQAESAPGPPPAE